MNDENIISVYTDALIALSETVREPLRLPEPAARAKAVSPVCGSVVTVDLKIENGKVTAFGYAVEACALTRAAVAVLRRAAIGKTRGQIAAAGSELRDMLENGGAPPGGDFSDLSLLAPVRDYPARHNALLLPFVAADRAFAAVTPDSP